MNIDEQDAESILQMAVVCYFRDCLDREDIVVIEKIFNNFPKLKAGPKFKVIL